MTTIHWSIVICVLVVSTAGCFDVGPSRRSYPRIVAAVDQTTLGTLTAQSLITRKLSLTNTASQDVHISKFVPSCNCSSINPQSLTIPGNSQKTITISITTPTIDRFDSTMATLPLDLSITPLLSIQGHTIAERAIAITGTVKTPLMFEPKELMLQRCIAEDGPAVADTSSCKLSGYIDIIALDEVRNITAQCADAVSLIELSPPVRNRRRLTVTRESNEDISMSPVRLVATMADGQRLIPIEVPILAKSPSIIEIEPPVLTLSTHPGEPRCRGSARLKAGGRVVIKGIEFVTASKQLRLEGKSPTLDCAEWIVQVEIDADQCPSMHEVRLKTITNQGDFQGSLIVVAQ